LEIREPTFSYTHSLIFDMSNVTLFLGAASQTGPILGTVEVTWDRGNILLGSTDLEGGLAPLEVASVVFRADKGEDDNVNGNDTDENTLDEGVVRNNLGTGWCLNRSFMVIPTGWGEAEDEQRED
jgi:hypothetical protein